MQKKNNSMVILTPVFSCFVVSAPGMEVSANLRNVYGGMYFHPA